MSEKSDDVKCGVCVSFEPQAWRKTICKNCFHTQKEHDEGVIAPAPSGNEKTKGTDKKEPDVKNKTSEESDKSKPTAASGASKNSTSKINISLSGKKSDTSSVTDSKTQSKDSTSKTGVTGSAGKTSDVDKLNSKSSLSSKFSSNGRTPGAISSIASKFSDSVKGKVGSSSVSSKLVKDKNSDVSDTSHTSSSSSIIISTSSEKSTKSDAEKHSKKEPATPSTDESKSDGEARAQATGSSFSFVKRLSKSFSEDEASSDAQESQTKDQQVTEKSDPLPSDTTLKSQSPEKKPAASKGSSLIGSAPSKAISSLSSKFFTGKQNNQKDKDKDALKTNSKPKEKDKDSFTKTASSTSPKTSLKYGTKSSEAKDKEKEKGSSVSLNRSTSCPSPKTSLRHVSLNSRDKDKNGLSRSSANTSPKSSLKHISISKSSPDRSGSPKSSPSPKANVRPTFPKSADKDSAKDSKPPLPPTTHSTAQTEFDDKAEVEKLRSEIGKMEEQFKALEEEKKSLAKDSSQKEEYRKSVDDLKTQLKQSENKCSRLESENKNLSIKLKEQDKKKIETDANKIQTSKTQKATEDACEILRQENLSLQKELRELKQEMDEMYDQFRESEAEEYRELHKELEVTAKNCRILQFKLRKTERRNDQVESERQHYEDKIRTVQSQFEDNDAKQHIRTLEEELKMAKDVSVRLNDELDILEDRRGRLEEENTKLQEILTKQDKKEFRMEMEIDKLTDRLDELQQQLIKAKRQVEDRGGDDLERTQKRPVLQTQVSTEYEVSQILRDLYDSIERENDLKDQLHFTEEEIKLTRKKNKELEDENENLNFQLKKMTSTKTVMTVRRVDTKGHTTDIDIEPNEYQMQLKLELDLSEQENCVLRKNMLDLEQENETYLEEIATLAKRISDKDKEDAVLPPPSSPNAYYEDKIKEMNYESDDLKWKLIEKEREIERLEADMVDINSRSQAKLRKSHSLDSDSQILDLKRQLDLVTRDADVLRTRAKNLELENRKLSDDIKRVRLQASRQIPSIQADDAAVENIELRDKVKKLEEEKFALKTKLRSVTENIHSLTKDVPHRPKHVTSEHDAKTSQYHREFSRETEDEIRLMEEEASVLRRKMAELETENSKLTREVGRLRDKVDKPSTPREKNPVMSKDTDDGKTVLELREKISEMKDEINDLLLIIKRREESNNELEKEVMDLRKVQVDLKDEFRKTEMELLQDLEMAQQKGDVLSNLLELVSERAEATEKELERVINESTPCPSTRSASAVSALSDASTGSDDVFLAPPSPTGDRPVIAKDWENQIKKRVGCLERLLAEERHKVAAAEKKLSLVSDETLSSAMSDDVKLRLREKEILQKELVENQRHLMIASDQIKGLRDRLQCAEESHHKIKMDYEALVRELDRREELEEQISMERGDVSGISTLQGLHEELRRYKDIAEKMEQSGEMELDAHTEIGELKSELAKYKLKSEELEYKVEEINEIWVSKSGASEKEKRNLEIQLQALTNELSETKEANIRLQNEVKQKENLLLTSDKLLREKDTLVNKRDDIIQEQEDIIKNRDTDFQTMFDQLSQRDETLRDLRDALSIRDERLKEKDEIIQRINVKLDGVSMETTTDVKSRSDYPLQGRPFDNTAPISDSAKENSALNLHINDLQKTVAQLRSEMGALRNEAEKLRKEISNKEYSWQLDKSNLITEMKTYKEKCNYLESANKLPEGVLVGKLTDDNKRLIEEKETLLGEVRKLQLDLDNTIKSAEDDKDEHNRKLTDRNKTIEENLLFAERVQNEAARLRSQAELAYRLQQEEKILRAELLAMKVRYETRLEKLQREYNKLHNSAEKIQRERDLDKDIIRGIQRGMGELKARYTQDVASWQGEKLQLERKVKEIEEGRRMVNDLRKLAEDLKKRVVEQERIRANTVNTFNMEKTAWEIEKSNMQSKINQLEEKLSSKTQTRSREAQNKLEVTWDKERAEQKRLLVEAHNLALDLQQQLKSRDEANARDLRELKDSFEDERSKWENVKKESEMKIQELEGYTRRISDLQKQFKEVKDRDNSEKEAWQKEKCDLVRRLTDARQFQMRQNRKIDDILHTLKRLRELATLVQDVEMAEDLVRRSPEGVADDIPDHEQLQKTLDHAVLKYMRDSIQQLNVIMTDLEKYLESVQDSLPYMKRSLSTSQVDSVDHDDPESESTSLNTSSKNHKLIVSRKTSQNTYAQNSSVTSKVNDVDPSSRGRWVSTSASPRPPSYASGSRSAQSSRSASPDKHHSRTSFSPVRKITNYPDPPPSFLISPPHQYSSRNSVDSGSQEAVNSTDMGEVSQRLARPQQLTKSISMDSAPLNSFTAGFESRSHPGQLPAALFTNPNDQGNTSLSHGNYALSPQKTGSLDRLSPRTARKKFFADDSNQATQSSGFQAWPDRKTSIQALPIDPKSTEQSTPIPQQAPFGYNSLPDRRSKALAQSFDLNSPELFPLTGETDGVSPLDPHQIEMLYYPAHGAVARNLPPVERPPMTWDEKVNIVDNTGLSSFEKAKTIGGTPSQFKPFQSGQGKSATLGAIGAKEKRKFFRKSSSLDSTSVSASLGKVAVQMLPTAVPSGFTPSDLLAAVKRKFRPNLKKTLPANEAQVHTTPSIPISKSADNMADISGHTIRSLDAFRSSDVSPALTPSPTSPSTSPFQSTEPTREQSQEETRDPLSVPRLTQLFPKPPTPPNRRPPRRWRSKSADRAEKSDRHRQPPKPIIMHADIITPIKVWKFSETSV